MKLPSRLNTAGFTLPSLLVGLGVLGVFMMIYMAAMTSVNRLEKNTTGRTHALQIITEVMKSLEQNNVCSQSIRYDPTNPGQWVTWDGTTPFALKIFRNTNPVDTTAGAMDSNLVDLLYEAGKNVDPATPDNTQVGIVFESINIDQVLNSKPSGTKMVYNAVIKFQFREVTPSGNLGTGFSYDIPMNITTGTASDTGQANSILGCQSASVATAANECGLQNAEYNEDEDRCIWTEMNVISDGDTTNSDATPGSGKVYIENDLKTHTEGSVQVVNDGGNARFYVNGWKACDASKEGCPPQDLEFPPARRNFYLPQQALINSYILHDPSVAIGESQCVVASCTGATVLMGGTPTEAEYSCGDKWEFAHLGPDGSPSDVHNDRRVTISRNTLPGSIEVCINGGLKPGWGAMVTARCCPKNN